MSKELNNLISSLSEDNFKRLIQEFNKEKYKTPHVRIVDGPYDGGNDLEILIDDKEVRKNIQITVQKTDFEAKLNKDLKKSKENAVNYGYHNSLDFYISQNISKEKRNELEMHAEVTFGIQLKIIDATILSQEALSFTSIRDFTYEAHNLPTGNSNSIADKQTKVLFDVLTLGKNSVEIKRNFINAYIYSYLYAVPDSETDDIFSYVNPHLNNTLHKEFLEKELNYLRSKKHLFSHDNKRKFRLSDEKEKEIRLIYSNVTTQEETLKTTIDSFISTNKINCTCTDLLSILYKLYQENYKIDINEVNNTGNSFSASIKKSYNDLISFFVKKGVAQAGAKAYARDILRQCDSSDFLNKLSSIHLFNNLYSSDKLEKYINEKIQKIVIDTQILIRLICVLYDEKFEYTDQALQSVRMLLSTFENFKKHVRLVSSYDYVGEVAGHLAEALKLQRFVKLPFVSKLGRSKNVFFNAFLDLKLKDVLEDEIEFSDFVESLIDEDISDKSEEQMISVASRRIAEILELAGIELIYHPTYQNYPIIKKEYEVSLAYASKDRSYTARENDLRTILYLATKENHMNIETGELNEPFLITWDSAFYHFRKKLLETHKELSYWYIYSPLKVVDRLSVMNFNLNPKSISLNIIALTETNFNYSTKSTSFIDVISSFFNSKDVSKLTIINKLAALKNEARNIEEVPVVEEFSEKEGDTLTHILLNLRSHYYSGETKYKFDEIVKVFEMPEFENAIVEILEKTINEYNPSADLKIMIQSFDLLIEENRK